MRDRPQGENTARAIDAGADLTFWPLRAIRDRQLLLAGYGGERLREISIREGDMITKASTANEQQADYEDADRRAREIRKEAGCQF